MATKHNVLLTDNDQRLLADIDLSILGESTKLFDQYETNIRKEYIAIPQEVYRTERIKVLQYFSRKEEIFYHRSFLNMYEKQAKKNLQKSIAKLHNETH